MITLQTNDSTEYRNSRSPSRLLMVPHAPQVQIRTRAMELSKALSRIGTEVDIYTRNVQPRDLSAHQKAQWHLSELSLGCQYIEIAPRLRSLKLSSLHRINPLIQLADRLGAMYLERQGYDAIITSAYCGMSFRANPAYQLIYDYVDDHADGYRLEGHTQFAERIDQFMQHQIQVADHLIASGKVLVALAESRYDREATYIPNGADVTKIRAALQRYPQKGKVTLNPKLRIGYMGGLESFVNIHLVVEAIQEIHRRGIDAELVVVGSGPAIAQLPPVGWIHLLGFKQPDEIPDIVATFDIGVLPFELSPLTDAALPLKIIEYGAARCRAVASPIQELRLQQFPWVTLTPLCVKDWADEFERLAHPQWDSCWDEKVSEFDWNTIAAVLFAKLQLK